jgi:FkbM family methyltransferase
MGNKKNIPKYYSTKGNNSSTLERGIAAHKLGRYDEAKKIYENLLKKNPDNFDTLNLLGVLNYQLKNTKLSVELLKKAININANVAAAHSNLGCALLDLKLYSEALESLNIAIALDSNNVAAHTNKGNALKALGLYRDAVESYETALTLKSDFVEALSNLGTVLQELGDLNEALISFEKALKIRPEIAEIHYNRGNIYLAMNQIENSILCYERAIQIRPTYGEAYANYARALKINNELEKSIYFYKKAILLNPNLAEVWLNLGNSLQELNRVDEALEHFDKAVLIRPSYAEAHFCKGNLYLNIKNYAQAIECYQHAINIMPTFAEAYSNLGNALRYINRLEDAIRNYEKAIELKKDYIDAYSNLGGVLQECKRVEEAIVCLNKAITLNPNFAEAYSNLGNAYFDLGLLDESIICCEKAIEIKPNLAEAHFNRANALKNLKRFDDAILGYNSAIALKPNYAEALMNKGQILQENHLIDEALDLYEKAYLANEKSNFLFGFLLHSRYKICDWTNFENNNKKLKNNILNGERVSSSFAVLSIFDSSEIHKISSLIWSDSKNKQDSCLGKITKKNPNNEDKIKIGYFSADFYNHATAYLIAELFEAHDKNKFELYGFAFGQSKKDEMKLRLSRQFNSFIDVQLKTAKEIASLSRELGIDIAVDLKGFTQDSRTEIFAYRCAPIQVNYLGYPGTMGAPYFDYIIADKIVIPEESKKNYIEKIVYLPNSYQVNDSQRIISQRVFSKVELGLPENGFIFCCFNNNYKITPSIFDCWMRILKAIQESVLWLFEDNPTAAKNLRKEAEMRGVASSRLVFAKRMPLDEHLARHRHADLFIDTLPYNAHTTASDALWAGLPVLTLIGESFPARVASSLLSAIGLPELITTTLEDYEAKAIELARNPYLIEKIKLKLAQNRLTTPLFNTQQFTKNIENAYKTMYERYQKDLPPDHLYIEDVYASQESVCLNKIKILPKSNNKPNVKFLDIFEFNDFIQVMDIGASAINEIPFYKELLDAGLAHLNAFEGDLRQIDKIKNTYKDNCTIFTEFLFDGSEQTLYIASEASGMSSLLKPNQNALNFFNGFNQFGKIERTQRIQTKKLDDLTEIKGIDLLKMDIQGAELTVLKNAKEKLKDCLAVQLEVSYITLYENQPCFGDIDLWMRKQGYVPHCFLDIKRWSIAPTIFNDNFRIPGNQLLESDIVYIKDPLKLEFLSNQQIIKFIAITHHALKSFDLSVFLLLELARRKIVPSNIQDIYLKKLNAK